MSRIRILATSDMHGYIYPYSYADGKSFSGGMARLKTLCDSLRDEQTLLIDNGDVLEGSPLSFYHYHQHASSVSPMTACMSQMHYDFINLGNHDFNYGEAALMRHINSVSCPCLCANALYNGKPIGDSYTIRTIAGKRIALFGIVTSYIPHWETPDHIEHFQFIDAFETAQKITAEIKAKEKPDFIICIYHGGLERDIDTGILTEDDTGENQGSRILNNIPDLDVLICGHQHRSICQKINRTFVTSTAANATELACIDIDTDSRSIAGRLIPAIAEADTEMMKSVQNEENNCQIWLDQSLGSTDMDLEIKDESEARIHKSQVITLLNQIAMHASNSDMAACALFNGARGFKKQITMRNLVSTYVFPNTLTVKKVTGRVLKLYLEKNAEFFCIENGKISVSRSYLWPKPQQYNYDMLDGASYTIKVSNPVGSRIENLCRNGIPIQDNDVFTLAINNYRASGGGNFSMLKDAPTAAVYQNSMVELIADYILERKTISFKPIHNIQVIE